MKSPIVADAAVTKWLERITHDDQTDTSGDIYAAPHRPRLDLKRKRLLFTFFFFFLLKVNFNLSGVWIHKSKFFFFPKMQFVQGGRRQAPSYGLGITIISIKIHSRASRISWDSGVQTCGGDLKWRS